MKQDNNAYRTDYLYHFGDSSNYAQEGMGIPEFLQFLKKSKETQEKIKKELVGTTCEVPDMKEGNNYGRNR